MDGSETTRMNPQGRIYAYYVLIVRQVCASSGKLSTSHLERTQMIFWATNILGWRGLFTERDASLKYMYLKLYLRTAPHTGIPVFEYMSADSQDRLQVLCNALFIACARNHMPSRPLERSYLQLYTRVEIGPAAQNVMEASGSTSYAQVMYLFTMLELCAMFPTCFWFVVHTVATQCNQRFASNPHLKHLTILSTFNCCRLAAFESLIWTDRSSGLITKCLSETVSQTTD